MLHNLKHISGHQLAASDGAIGHVKDFYFDDKTWAIRYLVADTGTWLTGRQVLLSPHAFGRLDKAGQILTIRLTRKQIENSPSIDAHRPVSRQYEENYFNYYGWPYYWEGGQMWGPGDTPAFTLLPRPYALASYDYPRWDDVHLRSTNAVNGYHIHTPDGPIGHVTGFLVDDRSWAIRELVVEAGHWYAGKEILIAPRDVERISYEDSTVFVNLNKETIQRTAENRIAHAGA